MASGAIEGSFTAETMRIRSLSITGQRKDNAEDVYQLATLDEDPEEEKGMSTEEYIQSEIAQLPHWTKQITIRGIIVGLLLGFCFCVIVHKLNLTVGVIPSLNIAAGLLGYFCIKTWVVITQKFGWNTADFTAQENTAIQTLVVAAYSLCFAGGFGSYYLALDVSSYEKLGAEATPGNFMSDTWPITIPRTMAYMLCIGLIGTFMLVILRKTMIIDYNLTYPSGTATGMLIKSFHTKDGGELAAAQVGQMGKWFFVSFFFSMFKWFWTGIQNACPGWEGMPTFGIPAANLSFHFDWAFSYVGVGMICPHEVSWSVMFGAIISWGILWRICQAQAGNWYSADLPHASLAGFGGYKNFIAISIFMADGGYNLLKVIVASVTNLLKSKKKGEDYDDVSLSAEVRKSGREKALATTVFLKDNIPWWEALLGYSLCAVMGCFIIPMLYKPVKWYYVLIAYLVGPLFSVANAYGCGLTDWSMASTYGKICIFIFAFVAGPEEGGVTVGLVVCGIMMASTAAAADLMQDFKTGYITLSSAKAMFYCQVIGAMGSVVLAPLSFEIFWRAFPVGDEHGPYPAPYAAIYRSMAIIGTEGLGALPKYCVLMAGCFLIATILLCIVRDLLPYKIARFVPIMMAAGIAFNTGGYLAIDMCMGSTVVLLWSYFAPQHCENFSAATASGLIAGEGIWSIPSAALAVFGVNPPMCMGFFSSAEGSEIMSGGGGH